MSQKKKKKPVLERLLEHSFPLFSGFTLYILAMHALLEMLLLNYPSICNDRYGTHFVIFLEFGPLKFFYRSRIFEKLRVCLNTTYFC